MNVVTMTGHLVADPARVETGRGVKATFRLAVDSRPRLWIDIDTWGHLAGTCAAHLRKSRAVAVTGRLACDEWTDRDGAHRQRYHVNATAVTFLDAPETGAAEP
jgi:single-stranded DNA-binding protein